MTQAPNSSKLNFQILSRWLLPIVAVVCLWPAISGGVALFLGLLVTLTVGNPYDAKTKKLTPQLLSLAVVGLGAGMNLMVVAKVGLHGIGYTIIGISSAFILGSLLGRFLKIDPNTSLLITVGTAICGGSAIAAVAPVLRAKPNQVSVALGIVFMLNACALFIFPPIGHFLQLTQNQFGIWAALAIHDTSSVVGASLQYGAEALQVGTTMKLARALWIVPVTFVIGMIMSRKDASEDAAKAKKPWFILGFLILAAITTWVPSLQPAGHVIEFIAKRAMVLTLFLIGSNLNREAIKSVGLKPFMQGIILWIVIGFGTLAAIDQGWIG